MQDDALDLQKRLGRAWQQLAERLVASGTPAIAVYESLLEAGIVGMVDLVGPRVAGSILSVRADTLANAEHQQVESLITGEAPLRDDSGG